MTSNSGSLYITQIRFCRALAVVRSLPIESGGIFQPSALDKLNFYGLYKQALMGDCMLLRPLQKNSVQYAKWKAWDKLRGISPIDAQLLYVQALIDLLKEFLEEYPNSELTTSIYESVHYLEETGEYDLEEESLIQWDTNSQENEEFYLGQIDQDQILQSSSYSYSTTELPVTPELTPKTYLSKLKSLPSSTTSSLKQHRQEADHIYPKRVTKNNVAIQALQLEVRALCEEIDQLRHRDGMKASSILKWRSLWLVKSIAKHAFFNFLILILLFIVLWRRRSPIAYAIMSNSGTEFKSLLSFLFRRVVFWKVTV